jgi:hypothetical protein
MSAIDPVDSVDPVDFAKAVAGVTWHLANALARQSEIHVECLTLLAEFVKLDEHNYLGISNGQRKLLEQLTVKHDDGVKAIAAVFERQKLQMQEWAV